MTKNHVKVSFAVLRPFFMLFYPIYDYFNSIIQKSHLFSIIISKKMTFDCIYYEKVAFTLKIQLFFSHLFYTTIYSLFRIFYTIYIFRFLALYAKLPLFFQNINPIPYGTGSVLHDF